MIAAFYFVVELSVRLHNTTDGNIGRLDIQHGGVWSPVCADSWEKEEATVACRQLGYHHSVSIQGSVVSPSDGMKEFSS